MKRISVRIVSFNKLNFGTKIHIMCKKWKLIGLPIYLKCVIIMKKNWLKIHF